MKPTGLGNHPTTIQLNKIHISAHKCLIKSINNNYQGFSLLTLYRPGQNQWSDPVQFFGGCFRGRPKTTRKKIMGNFRLLVAEKRFGHKCPARKSHGCPARRTCILKFANFYDKIYCTPESGVLYCHKWLLHSGVRSPLAANAAIVLRTPFRFFCPV